jgi:hypothetical protein
MDMAGNFAESRSAIDRQSTYSEEARSQETPFVLVDLFCRLSPRARPVRVDSPLQVHPRSDAEACPEHADCEAAALIPEQPQPLILEPLRLAVADAIDRTGPVVGH